MPNILKIGNALSALNLRRNNDLQQRRQATTILAPGEMVGSTSRAKLLTTTLHGEVRAITPADLVAFRRSAKALGAKLREGMTAQEVIDQSTPADRDRARKEILTAVASRLQGGSVLMVTPSGPHSKVARHFVSIVVPSYGAALSMPGTPLQAAAELVKAPLKFDCDCEQCRYRFRYIATAMGLNAGRPETGFPKLTNPRLIGVACKHVIRAMIEWQASLFVRKSVAKMIEADRARLTPTAKAKPRVIQATAEDAEKATHGRVRAIRTSDERHRNVIAAAVRRAAPSGRQSTSAVDINQTIKALQARKDIPAQAILRALRTVIQQYPQAKP